MRVAILLCRPLTPKLPVFAWLIMLFQKMLPWKKDSFSHMAIRIMNKKYEFEHHQVRFGGYCVQDEWEFAETYKVVRSYEFKVPATLNEIEDWIHMHRNKEYDFLQILGLIPKFIGLYKKNKIGNDLNQLICSEYIAHFMATFAGWVLCDSDNWDLLHTEAKLVRETESRRTA